MVLMTFSPPHALAIAIVSWNTPSVLPDFFQSTPLHALPLDLPLTRIHLPHSLRAVLLDQLHDYPQLLRREALDSIEDRKWIQFFEVIWLFIISTFLALWSSCSCSGGSSWDHCFRYLLRNAVFRVFGGLCYILGKSDRGEVIFDEFLKILLHLVSWGVDPLR